MIGKVLKYMRVSKGYKQEFIAKKMGIERTTLSGYEIERRQPDFSFIEKFAEYCDFDIYFINRISGEKLQSKDLLRKDL